MVGLRGISIEKDIEIWSSLLVNFKARCVRYITVREMMIKYKDVLCIFVKQYKNALAANYLHINDLKDLDLYSFPTHWIPNYSGLWNVR